MKSVAHNVDKMIFGSTDSPDFSNIQNSQEILDATNALKTEISNWETLYGENLRPHWGGIGTDTLYLRDDEVMQKIISRKKDGTEKEIRKGKYFETLKGLGKEIRKKFKGNTAKLNELPERSNSLETKLENLRRSLKSVFDPIKRDGQEFEVDLTSGNRRIPKETTLRDVFRVLQGFNNIGRERLWEKTRFTIEFGGRPVTFDLNKAPQGYFQIYYENPIKGERYGGTKYDEHIFKTLNTVKGDNDVETREKQVKLAEFIKNNLDSPIGEQPSYASLINEPAVPMSELEDVKIKRALDDLTILSNVAESGALPQSQLDHWSEKIKADSGIKLDTSADIKDRRVPGARREDYKSSGRTMALDTIFYDQLTRLISGDLSHKTLLNDVLSNEEFPARMKGGAGKSKRWAAKQETQKRSLPTSFEFAPLTSSIAPEPPSTSDTRMVTNSIAQKMLDKDNIGKPLDAIASDVEDRNDRGIKRKLVDADDDTIKAKVKGTSDIRNSDGSQCSKRQGVCSFRDKNIAIVEDSVSIQNKILTYNLYDTSNKNKRYTGRTELDPESLSSVKYGAEQDRYAKDSGRSATNKAVGTAFGIHGTIMSTFGAISSFQRGNIKQGVISTVQAAHSLGSLIIEKVGEKALLRAVAKGATKLGLTKIAEKASSKLLKMSERNTEKLFGDIPYVGLAFDAYFISEDISDLTKAVTSKNTEEIALDTVHLILDIGQTIANFIVDALGPEFEPIVWALSLIRTSIDDFYYDISDELKKAHGTGEKILAFFKGLGEGFVDFLTGGLLRSLQQLSEKQKNDTELLNKFGNPRLYFNLSSDCTTIDFTNGSFSAYGGGLHFVLNDDNSFTVTISDTPDEGGVYSSRTQRFTISSFQRGNIKQGVISTVQAAHSLGSLIIEKVGEKALLRAVAKGATKLGLTKIAEKASSKLLKMSERNTEKLFGDIPYVGLAFDAYFISEDISDLTKAVTSKNTEEIALDTVHLILDIGQTIANFIVDALGPEFEPIVWALSLIRTSIDDFYYDISDELKKAHGTGEKILAFFKGLGEGFVDFLTGGLLRSLQQLSEKQKNDTELLNKFGNPRLYFNLSSDCTTIDFTNGSFSAYGGGLHFVLNDDNSFTVTISDTPDEGGVYSSRTQRFTCPGLTDIILGIGESQTIEWKTQEAKLWAVIPVASAQVINNYTDDQNSLYGSYTGNKQNNTFIAFQGNFSRVLPNECQDPEATGVVDLRLKNYFYILNGMAGNDTFFLGPQKSHVTGGQGHDLYYLGTHGGKTVIDNFAYDKLSDTLWLNVSHGHVICGRKNYDLLIQYCGTHMVLVQNWFYPVTNDYRRHLVILTRDGVQLKVKDVGFLNDQYTVDCLPVSIDLSKSGKSQYLNLTESPYTEVVTVTGSNRSDTIIGNNQSNFINAGPGSNIIKGGEGEDTYMIKPKGGCDHIDNFADDQLQDKLFIPINYRDMEIIASTDSHTAAVEEMPTEKSNKFSKELHKIGAHQKAKKVRRSALEPMDIKILVNPQANLENSDDSKYVLAAFQIPTSSNQKLIQSIGLVGSKVINLAQKCTLIYSWFNIFKTIYSFTLHTQRIGTEG